MPRIQRWRSCWRRHTLEEEQQRFTVITRLISSMDVKSGEKLLSVSKIDDLKTKLLGEFPEWVNLGVRRLLQAGRPTPNVTVALDGTGDVKTIKEAMGMVPKKSKTVFIIYIKEGVYVENVVLDKSFWNVMIYGDNKDKSIVSANSKIKNHVICHVCR
ncbi:hypothetical protein LXL04_005868 [Taraxacum kok-saghyz]